MGLKYQLECDKVQRLQKHCGHALFSKGKSLYKDIFCVCPHWGSGPYIFRSFLIWTHFVNASWKISDLACTFPVQRKEIKVVKVRFSMRYSPRKLSHEKVITTAWNFWRQTACSFPVKSGNALLLGKKIFEIPPFFQAWPGDLGKKVQACSLRFSALKSGRDWASTQNCVSIIFVKLWKVWTLESFQKQVEFDRPGERSPVNRTVVVHND